MKRVIRIIAVGVGVLVLAGGGFLAYIWLSGGDGAATGPAEAVRVEPSSVETVLYAVDREASEARFLIDEVLRGEPTTVIGVTRDIDGSIAVRRDPGLVEIGEFVINVRTVRTDDEIRDRTIRTLILESARDEYEFSSFRPTAVNGTPETIPTGVAFELEVIGDLTVRDVTRSVAFEMTLELESDSVLSGYAETSITWDQFEISIPYVGGDSIVASVSDTVRLQLEFRAASADS